MRTINSNSLTQLATNLGTEPISVIGVSWNGGAPILYADKDWQGIPGKIIQLSTLGSGLNLQGASTGQITVTLDDTDGILKTFYDQNDLHLKNVWVYQAFNSLTQADMFLVFKGQINTPITWKEGDRTLTFTVVEQIEDQQIGFSAEEGDFPAIPQILIGKAWPIIFGRPLDVKALRFENAITGITQCGTGIISGGDLFLNAPLGPQNCSAAFSIGAQQIQLQHLGFVADAFDSAGVGDVSGQYRKQAQDLANQIAQTLGGMAQQDLCTKLQRQETLNKALNNGLGCAVTGNVMQIIGGEDFPQHKPIILDINGAWFYGTMNGDEFTVSHTLDPQGVSWAEDNFSLMIARQCNQTAPPPPPITFTTKVPCGYGNNGDKCTLTTNGAIACIAPQTEPPNQSLQILAQFWAPGGSTVRIQSAEPTVYIVSIVPGTVLSVKAYQQLPDRGIKHLVNVPKEHYTVKSTTYATDNFGNPVTAVEIHLKDLLSKIQIKGINQGWEDDLYVTFQSDVGPNTVDIIKYIISHWTALTYDSVTFDAVHALVDAFPMNFPILDRKNIIQVLQEIAMQARCALWLDNGVFKIKYLPVEPDSDDTITTSDITANSLQVDITPTTESIITKIIATYRVSWADGNGEQPNYINLASNRAKYGIHQETMDLYCFNQPDIAIKAATFWLIRKSNSWKQLTFDVPLSKLNLETWDTITLPASFASTNTTKGVVKEATYDSDKNTVHLVVETPVRAGELAPYIFYWPSDVDAEYPTPADVKNGNVTLKTTIGLPVGTIPKILITDVIFVGGPNIIYNSGAMLGDSSPGDSGFTAQPIVDNTTYINADNQQQPDIDLTANFRGEYKIPPASPVGDFWVSIDIATTYVEDSRHTGSGHAFFNTLISEIKSSNLYLKAIINVVDTSMNEATFEFKYDSDSDKYGAERAFLADSSS